MQHMNLKKDGQSKTPNVQGIIGHQIRGPQRKATDELDLMKIKIFLSEDTIKKNGKFGHRLGDMHICNTCT